MANNLMILARAGAGKTKYVTQELNVFEKRVLYVSYTNENTKNIQRFLSTSKHPKDLISVQTYHAFLLRNFIRPLIPFDSLENGYRGINWSDESKISKMTRYIKKSAKQFWMDNNDYLYGCRLSNLILYESYEYYFNLGIKRLNRYYDIIIFDEFQDLTSTDYEFLRKIVMKTDIQVILVGDLYQSNVTSSLNKKNPYNVTFKDEIKFVRNNLRLSKRQIKIDTVTLNKSIRITKDVAQYIRDNLGIKIFSKSCNEGTVIDVEKSNVSTILEKVDKILVWDAKTMKKIPKKYQNKTINWTKSKGLTYKSTCIVLTKKVSDFLNNNEKIDKQSTLNKFYVALTRSIGNVYLINRELI